MQDSYNQPKLRSRISSLEQHVKVTRGEPTGEFILFGDNLLECLALLNPAIELNDLWQFQYVVYEPHNSPRYVFRTQGGCYVVIRACGVYSNWPLPKKVAELIYKYDLPDFVLYDQLSDEIVCAGELTETASVGNSQWQRELRKIAAAESSIPFLYQTVYSGFDDSQGTIREPTSLLVYNAFVYSIRYGVASLVVLGEPNIPEAVSRRRENLLAPHTTSRLVASYIHKKLGERASLCREIEKEILVSMASYLGEVPHAKLKKEIHHSLGETEPKSGHKREKRLLLDFPCAPQVAIDSLLTRPIEFATSLVANFDAAPGIKEKFALSHDFTKIEPLKLQAWTDRRSARYISSMFAYVESKGLSPAKAPRSKFAVGILDTNALIQFLQSQSGASVELIRRLERFKETLIIPIALHKRSNGKLMFTKDPYAGNTAAFAELLALNSLGVKERNVVAYCTSDNPEDFDIHSKKNTSLYKCLRKYVDAMVVDSRIVDNFLEAAPESYVEYLPEHERHDPIRHSEDMGLLSTFLQMGVIGADWTACMIAIHHSSWQQIRVQNTSGITTTSKVGRDDSKVDLVMQSSKNHFLAAEGKRRFSDFMLTSRERSKITVAFENVRKEIDELYGTSKNEKTIAFVCLVDGSESKSELKDIEVSVKSNSLRAIAGQEHIVIACLPSRDVTEFRLFFSPDFSETKKTYFEGIFST